MRTITVLNHLSLDGVMQAPGRADEDTRDGFDRGGWAIADNDAVMGEVLGKGMAQGGSLLFGRRTYEDFASFWPAQTDNPFTTVLDAAEKYVVSTTLHEPLPWNNSRLLSGDGVESVAALKAQEGPDLLIMGSGVLILSLLQRRLIDRFMLMIHPLVLGTGRKMFADGGQPAELRLVDSVTTTTGVIIATYECA
jgi:dihydrofolate reductase